jgi:hypothetical protein
MQSMSIDHPIAILGALESAALAVGRLDAAARALEPGIQELLTLRCSHHAANSRAAGDAEGIIAILRADGEGEAPTIRLAEAFREGAARSRAGSAPSTRWIAESLHIALPSDLRMVELDALDERLRALRVGHGALLTALDAGAQLAPYAPLAASAMTGITLAHGGALGGSWCTVPVDRFGGEGAQGLVGLAEALTLAAREGSAAVASAARTMQAHETRIEEAYGRAAHGALAVLRSFRRWTLLEIPATARRLRCTRPTVAAAVERLEALGLVQELTGRGRDRVWCYSALAAALSTASVGANAVTPS